jgi:hypothetical protein
MIVYAEPKLTWETWQAKYRPKIRVCVDWDMLRKPKPKVHRWLSKWQFDDNVVVFFPWFGRKSWRNGEPAKAVLGHTDSIIVAPAVKFDGWGYLLLDSCHRISQHRPKGLILDYIEPRPHQLCAFNDLLGEWRYR